jgi:hypothetical protein
MVSLHRRAFSLSSQPSFDSLESRLLHFLLKKSANSELKLLPNFCVQHTTRALDEGDLVAHSRE